MDPSNRFHTATTYRMARLDYTALLLLGLALLALQVSEVHWGRFAIAFWWIDVIGYWPGALWYRLHGNGPRRSLPALFHHTYNTTHSVAVNACVLAVWMLLVGGWEWAMLAQPIHLCIDRGVFGNVYKPVELSFETVQHPLFEKFAGEIESHGRW